MDDRGVDGPPYPVALRLYAIAAERWAEIDAAYLSVDLIRLPPHRFCNAVYAWCVQHMTPEKREEWDFMLNAPLPGHEQAAPTETVIEAEGEAFMAVMAMNEQVTGG